MVKTFLLFLFLLLFPPFVPAETNPLRIAVAANFSNTLETLAPLFTAKYGVMIQPVFGSSGKLYAQLKNGAPYDLFLSADRERPKLLHEAGICNEPFVYAYGSVVLWAWDTTLAADSWQELLQSNRGKIAIANPNTAPYGTRALQALQESGLADSLSPSLVYGQSAGQAFVFVQTKNTRFGLVPLSHALSEQGRQGKYWVIPEAEAVDQWGCTVQKSKNRKAVQKLLTYFASDATRETLQNMGYGR